jgi:hypothetical protein
MPDWVLKKQAVSDAIDILRGQRIHPFFPAYLHLHRVAATQGTTTNIRPEWRELGPFFEVAGAPADHPYFRPFTLSTGEGPDEWLNPNIAGSYAPSSLRTRQPPLQVVEVGSGGHGYVTLRPKHWELAREHLLDAKQLPIAPVAAFFLRDYAFIEYVDAPGDDELIDAFAEMFGYGFGSSRTAFDHLFTRSIQATPDWFEEWHG